MTLILTSDFPVTISDVVVQRLRRAAARPRVAWIPPLTSTGHAHFAAAEVAFRDLGVSSLEYCDIDEEPNETQLSALSQYDAVYLTGGEPLQFRHNILKCNLVDHLRECLATDRLVIAASGGAMQLTPNLSLFRLLTNAVDEVLDERAAYDAMGAVGHEILPHLNRHSGGFLGEVDRYSQGIGIDILGIEDGAVVIHEADGREHYAGRVLRFRRGVRTIIDGVA